MDEVTDTRRLTHGHISLHISGATGADDGPKSETMSNSWISALSSIFCGRLWKLKLFTSRDKMQVLSVPPQPLKNFVGFYVIFFNPLDMINRHHRLH